MLEIGLPIVCALVIFAPVVHREIDPRKILSHFEIMAIAYEDHPEPEKLVEDPKIPPRDAIVIDINCDKRGDFMVVVEDDEGNNSRQPFLSRPSDGEPGTISLIFRRPANGRLYIGIERDGETVFVELEGL